MIYVRGADSVIAQALKELHPIQDVPRGQPMPLDGNLYLWCVGRILQKRESQQTEEEKRETWFINHQQVVEGCDELIDKNENARICVIGSESGFKGSYDGVYARAKMNLHWYVENKRLKHPRQQLVCVAPTCISGTRMNLQRNEDGMRALGERLKTHPKGRWLWPSEVAKLIYFLLCIDQGYITNCTIRMNGGEHAQH